MSLQLVLYYTDDIHYLHLKNNMIENSKRIAHIKEYRHIIQENDYSLDTINCKCDISVKQSLLNIYEQWIGIGTRIRDTANKHGYYIPIFHFLAHEIFTGIILKITMSNTRNKLIWWIVLDLP